MEENKNVHGTNEKYDRRTYKKKDIYKCKDCRWWEFIEYKKTKYGRTIHLGICQLTDTTIKDDKFCYGWKVKNE